MRRLVARLIFAVVLAGPVLAQAPVTPQDTLAYTTASVRLREKPFANARALAALPQGTAVRLYTCSQGWCKVAATSILKGSRSRRPRAPRTGSRPRGLQPTAGMGRSASVAPAKGPARITAAWRS